MDKKSLLQAILTKPKKLHPRQEEAVLSDKAYVRIVAGAGAGKTETLTRRIAYLLLYKDQPPASMVAFTFTERAAQSMKDRIYQRVGELRGEDACNKLGEMYVGTIHAYCLRLLQDHFGYGNFESLDENQEMAFLMRHGWSMGLHTKGENYSEECGEFARSVGLVYDELIDRSVLAAEAPDFSAKLEKYEKLLRRHKVITFGQMIELSVEHLSKERETLSGIRHLIVDEYQDINRAQERLIGLIGRKATVFVVGDPRQCIYRWRGSDESYFKKFTKSHRGAHPITITQNNRSCRKIVDAANSIARGFGVRYEELEKVRPRDGLLAVVACDTPDSEAAWVVGQIARLVRKDQVCNYSNIAILLRSVSTSGSKFIEACRRNDVPYMVGGKVGLFRRDEALAVGYLYAWLADDGFWVKDRWSRERIQGSDLLGDAEKLINGLHAFPKFPRARVLDWRGKCRSGKFSHFSASYQAILEVLGYCQLDPTDKLHAAIMANLGRFNSLLTDFESAQRRGGDSIDWQKTWMNLVWFMSSYAITAYEEQPAEDLRGVDAVQIMTVHQAKGLEWPVVFVPCMTAKRFPSSKAGQSASWQVPKDLFDVERYRGGTEDELKLFYVAVTRARDVCCLSYHERINNYVGMSPFVTRVISEAKRLTEDKSLPKVTVEDPGDQEEIQTYSGGEIIGYRRCPYFYLLREQWNYQAGLDAALGYGKSLHHCLRVASGRIKQGADGPNAISAALDAEFHLPFAGSPIRQTMLSKARKTLTAFVEKNAEDMRKVEEVEARLEYPIQRATITGRVDVILRGQNGQELEVRDYKTSDEVTTTKESSLQVRLYALGLRKMGRNITRASIAYLDTGEIKPVDISKAKMDEAHSIAQGCVKAIAKGKYKAKPKKRCRCDYTHICRFVP